MTLLLFRRNPWIQYTATFFIINRWKLWSSRALWGLLWPGQGPPGWLGQGRCEERHHQLLHWCLHPPVPDLHCHRQWAGEGWGAREDAGIPHQGIRHGQRKSVTHGAFFVSEVLPNGPFCVCFNLSFFFFFMAFVAVLDFKCCCCIIGVPYQRLVSCFWCWLWARCCPLALFLGFNLSFFSPSAWQLPLSQIVVVVVIVILIKTFSMVRQFSHSWC